MSPLGVGWKSGQSLLILAFYFLANGTKTPWKCQLRSWKHIFVVSEIKEEAWTLRQKTVLLALQMDSLEGSSPVPVLGRSDCWSYGCISVDLTLLCLGLVRGTAYARGDVEWLSDAASRTGGLAELSHSYILPRAQWVWAFLGLCCICFGFGISSAV